MGHEFDEDRRDNPAIARAYRGAAAMAEFFKKKGDQGTEVLIKKEGGTYKIPVPPD